MEEPGGLQSTGSQTVDGKKKLSVGGLLGVAGRLSGTVSPFRAEQGTSLDARVTAGPKRPHLGLCPGSNVALQGRQGSRV